MYLIDNFFLKTKPDSLELNWEYIDNIPEFAKLKTCEQNPKWHSEGNAYEHTKRCIEVAYNRLNQFSGFEEKRIALLEVLFHDIGKGVTTEFKNGAWHAYNHEIEGEKITRRILWDMDFYVRERICATVRYHMEPLKIAESTHDFLKKITIPTFDQFFNWKDVLFVKYCDVLGSTPADEKETSMALMKVNFLSDAIDEFNLAAGYKSVKGAYNTIVFGRKEGWNPHIIRPKVYVMIGLPGAGKNYFIEHCDDKFLVSISRDDIRAELGYCKEGDKVVLSPDKEKHVSEVFNERFINAVADNKNVVLNNINLKKAYREGYKALLKNNELDYVDWVYVYIEARDMETLLHRRTTIPFNVYESMIDKFDWPRPGEYNDIYIVKAYQ